MRKLSICISVLFMYLCTAAFGAEVQWTSREEGEAIEAGLWMEIEDGDYYDLGTGAFQDVNTMIYLRFGLQERSGMSIPAGVTSGTNQMIRAKVRLTLYDDAGAVAGVQQEVLSIYYNYATPTAVNVDASDFRAQDVHRMTITVDWVEVNGLQGAVIPDYVFLEGGFYAERYYVFDSDFEPEIALQQVEYDQNGTASVISTTNETDPDTDELYLSWDYVPGAEEYELEWTWVDNYKETDVAQYIAANALAFSEYDFRHNSTRIRTSDQFYRIPQVFSKGYVIYRVRGVGRWSNDVTKEMVGTWSSGSGSKTYVSHWDYVRITTEHDGYKNWQYQATYAEDGKKKEVTQYFDGSLRGRQTVTRINSKDQSVVGETIYDNEGRGVIQALPVPQNNPAIQHYPGLSMGTLNGETVVYDHRQFDWEETATCGPSAAPMDNGSGAAQYYSVEAHTGDENWQQYVPESDGYPFTQVEYTPDNTGRIRRQSGVGPDHKIGSKHETVYYYMQPTQEELNRLFGYKVGYMSRYKKNMVVDANGQVSVSYLDAQGRVIATAMAGDNPTTSEGGSESLFDPLASEQLGSDYHHNMATDLLNNGGLVVDTENDNNERFSSGAFGAFEDGLKFTKEIGFPMASIVDFDYTVETGSYSETCAGSVSFPYIYDLVLTLRNDCGEDLFQEVYSNVSVGDIGQLTSTFTAAPTPFSVEEGTYSLVKELTVNEAALEAYVHEYLKPETNNCLPDLTEAFPEVVATDCNMTDCQACVDNLGTEAAFLEAARQNNFVETLNPEQLAYYTALYAQLLVNCEEPCEPLTSCNVYRQMLLSDFFPGNQYALYNYNETTELYGASSDPTSVFFDDDWTQGSYTDELGNVLTFSNTDADRTYFISNFREEWAEALLDQHPEYTLYQYWEEICSETYNVPTSSGTVALSSEEFDRFLRNEILTYENAQSAFNALGIDFETTPLYTIDPFFQTNYSVMEFTNVTSIANMYAIRNHLMTTGYGTDYKGLGQSLFEAAAQAVLCQADLTNGCTNLPTSFTDPGFTGLSTEEKDAIWLTYKGFYLSLKGEINQFLLDLHGFDSWVSGHGIYNGCMDNGSSLLGGVQAFSHVTQSPYPYPYLVAVVMESWGAGTIGFDHLPLTLCGNEYDSKQVRIVRTDVLSDPSLPAAEQAQQTEDEADYMYWEATGLCPPTVDMELLLQELLGGTGTILPVSGYWLMSEQSLLTWDLFEAITGGISPQAGSNMKISWSVNGSGALVLDFQRYENNDLFTPIGAVQTITLPQVSGTYTWSTLGASWQVNTISHSYPETGAGNNVQILLALETIPGGVVEEKVIAYSGTVDLNGCQQTYADDNSLSAACTEKEELEDALLNLMLALCEGQNLGSDVDVSSFPEYVGTVLPDYFGPTAFWMGATGNAVLEGSLFSLDFGTAFGASTCVSGLAFHDNQLYLSSVTASGSTYSGPQAYTYAYVNESTSQSVALDFSCGSDCYTTNELGNAFATLFAGMVAQGTFYDPAPYSLAGNTAYIQGALPAYFGANGMWQGLTVTDVINVSSNGADPGVAFLFDNTPPAGITGVLSMELTETPGGPSSGTFSLTVLNASSTQQVLTGTFMYSDAAGNKPRAFETCPCGDDVNSQLLTLLSNFFNEALQLGPAIDDTQPQSFVALNPYSSEQDLTQCTVGYDFELNFGIQGVSGTQAFGLDATGTNSATLLYLTNFQYDATNGFTCVGVYDDGSTMVFEGNLTKLVDFDTSTDCHEEVCVPEALPPVSCTDLYDVYETAMDAIGASYTQADLDEFNSDYKLNETAFCQGQYAYITNAYAAYLDDFAIEGVDDPHYLSIANFGNTFLGYSDAALGEAVTAYVASIYADPTHNLYLPWNSYVNEVYSAQIGTYCPPLIYGTPISLEPGEEDPCAWTNNVNAINAATQEEIYVEQLAETFRQAYLEGALATVKESFTMSYDDKEYHYTLYYYDRAGNLIQTVPPKGVKRFEYAGATPVQPNPEDQLGSSHADINELRSTSQEYEDWENPNNALQLAAPQHEVQTVYHYNSLNQLVYQQTPDGGISRFAYDYLGRLVLSQNAKQAANDQYSYTRYDALGRVTEVGQLTQAGYDINDNGRLVNGAGTEVNLPNSSDFPNNFSTDREQVTRSIYDELPNSLAVTSYNGGNPISIPIQSLFGNGYAWDNTRNRIVGVVYIETLNPSAPEDNTNYANGSFYDYDVHGNVKHLIQVNNASELVALNQHVKHVEYEYDLVSGNVHKVIYQRGKTDQFIHRYSYDDDNRITIAETSEDGFIYEKDAKYFYYDHGPLARTEIGERKVQALDYAYTVQGWLKSVNGETLSTETMMGQDGKATTINAQGGRDAMGFSLSYFDNDYTSANTSMVAFSQPGSTSGVTQLGSGIYNGNIRTMYTALTNTDEEGLMTHQTNYAYDQLNRIKAMDGLYKQTADQPGAASGYASTYTFDASGNLETLSRTVSDGGSALPMDNFSYVYTSGTNQLEAVKDAVMNTGGLGLGDIQEGQEAAVDNPTDGANYQYDEIGQLIKDRQEDIVNIDWTVTNKVREVSYMDGKVIRFDYDAMGNRIAKHVTESGETTTTYYVMDAQGNPMSIYTLADTDNKLYLSERNIYGSSRLGMENAYSELTEEEPVTGGNRLLLENYSEVPLVGLCNVAGGWFYETSGTTRNVEDYDGDGNLDLRASNASGAWSAQTTVNVIPGQDFTITFDVLYMSGGIVNPNSRRCDNGASMIDLVITTPGTYSYTVPVPLDAPDSYRFKWFAYAGTEYVIGNIRVQGAAPNAFGNSGSNISGSMESEVVAHRNSDKRYELSNHLGNVLNVVTDRKIPTVVNSIILDETFSDTDVTDWTSSTLYDNGPYTNSASFSATSPTGELIMSSDGLHFLDNVMKQVPTEMGESYVLSFDLVSITGGNEMVVSVGGDQYDTGTSLDPFYIGAVGSYNFSFTAYTANEYVIFLTGNNTEIRLDNVHLEKVDGALAYTADVVSYSDYYPYGMQLPGERLLAGMDGSDPSHYVAAHGSEGDYRYGFQGQEGDLEIKGQGNHWNYKYRGYDPRTGRFFAVDPLTHKFPYYSPYQFSSNSPIMAVELEGLETSVQINYTEKSIEITKEGNRLVVHQNQLFKIGKENYYSRPGVPYTEKKLYPGGYIDVPCVDCSQHGELVMRIRIPTEDAIRYMTIEREITEEIEVKDKRTETRNRTTAPKSIYVGNEYGYDDAELTTMRKNKVRGIVKEAIADLPKGSVLNSIDIVSDGKTKQYVDYAVTVIGLEVFTKDINRSVNSDLESQYSFKLNYSVPVEIETTRKESVTRTVKEQVPITKKSLSVEY